MKTCAIMFMTSMLCRMCWEVPTQHKNSSPFSASPGPPQLLADSRQLFWPPKYAFAHTRLRTCSQRAWASAHHPDLEHVPAPEHLYEHFLVCGLPPDADVSAVSASRVARRAAKRDGVKVCLP